MVVWHKISHCVPFPQSESMVLETSENVNNGNPSPLEALLAGAEGFPPMLDIPPDADDETMVELAIALSLQQDQQGKKSALLLLKKGNRIWGKWERSRAEAVDVTTIKAQVVEQWKAQRRPDLTQFVCRKVFIICFLLAGSSSSALGLQSLGLSGQAPSSSSLDAGTLSDTTASGNCSLRGIKLFCF